MVKSTLLIFIIIGLLSSCKTENLADDPNYKGLAAMSVDKPIVIDGNIEKAWNSVAWQNIDQVWLGENLTRQDFKGQYKLLYDKNYLYVLANITDDVLMDEWKDGLKNYWDDDCLEIFIDEDMSKGEHTYNHNAFAYHIGIDGRVVDLTTDSVPAYYDNHIKSARNSRGVKHIWEAAIKIYDDSYIDGETNTPKVLERGKQMGFAIAYCDNDYSGKREHFIGSTAIEGEDKNKGWIDAGVFEELRLK